MTKKSKISSTAYRVLILMNLLNRSEYDVDELNEIFSMDPYIARTLSREGILKYISTIRSTGYFVSKPCLANNYKYTLKKSPVKIKLLEDDINTIVVLENFVESLHQKRLIANYSKFVEKISRYLTEEQVNFLNYQRKHYREILENMQNMPT
jgi:hypothetical protein